MDIKLPKGYQPPDNAKPGEPFEVVATLVMEEDGEFELKAIDGIPLPEDKEDQEDQGEDEGAEDEQAPDVNAPDHPLSKFSKSISMPWGDEEDQTK